MAIHLFSGPNCTGSELVTYQEIPDLKTWGWNDAAVSARSTDEFWILYSDANYQGTSYVIASNQQSIPLGSLGSYSCCSSLRPVPQAVPPGSPMIVLFRDSNYRGSWLIVKGPMPDLRTQNFNDAMSSAMVIGGTWDLYDAINYTGNSKTLAAPGSYKDSVSVGLSNDTLSSLRPRVYAGLGSLGSDEVPTS